MLFDKASPVLIRGSLSQFSAVALVVVALLIATGLLNIYFLLPDPAAALHRDYGRLLGVKLGLVGIILVFGLVNRIGLKRGRLSLIHLNIVLEQGLGLAVLAIVAALGLLPPT
jgi:putative copper export protein